MNIFKLVGEIAINSSGAVAAIDETTKEASELNEELKDTDKAAKDVSNGGFTVMKSALGNLVANGIMKVIQALGQLVSDSANYSMQMEQYATSFEVMTGSAEKAAEVTQKLQKLGAATPFEMTDLANTTQLLMNYGFTADDAIAKMTMLGDISQGNADKMGRIAAAYGQMSSAGKVSLEDIKQMIEAGFNPLQEISTATGESMASLYDRVSQGTISIDEITASMERSTAKGGKYFNSMEKQSKTLSGRLSTLKDTVNASIANALNPLLETLANDILPKVTSFIEQIDFGKIGSSLLTIIQPLSEIGAKILPVILEVVGKLMQPLLQIVEKVMPLINTLLDTLLPLLDPLLEALTPLLDLLIAILEPLIKLLNYILPPIIEIITVVADLLAGALAESTKKYIGIIEKITPIIEMIGKSFKNEWEQTKAKWEVAAAFFKKVVDGIKAPFVTIADWFKDKFTQAWQNVKNVFSTGGQIFSGIKEGISGVFKTVVNGLINGINTVLNVPFNKINEMLNKIRNVSVLGITPFANLWAANPLAVPQIPQLEAGTVLEKGQVGLLEGNGAEAVVPLDKNKKWLRALGQDMQSELGFGNNQEILNKLDKLIAVIQQLRIYLYGDVLVGELAPAFNTALGDISLATERGQ